jgi:hypothetical protein
MADAGHHYYEEEKSVVVLDEHQLRRQRWMKIGRNIGIAFIALAAFKLVNYGLRRSCSAEGSSPAKLDPAKETRFTCRLQRGIDLVANADKRIVSAVAYKTYHYDNTTGQLNRLGSAPK